MMKTDYTEMDDPSMVAREAFKGTRMLRMDGRRCRSRSTLSECFAPH
jgi:hypothetical protein